MLDDHLFFQALGGFAAAAVAVWLVLRGRGSAEPTPRKPTHEGPAPRREPGDDWDHDWDHDSLEDEPVAGSGAAPFITFGADGVTTIHTGGGVLQMNAPTAEPDPGEPSGDAADVAERVVAERASKQNSDIVDPTYVDALVLLLREGRRAADLPAAARRTAEFLLSIDVHDAAAALRGAAASLGSAAHSSMVSAVVGERWPMPTAKLFLERGREARLTVVAKVAEQDPEVADRLAGLVPVELSHSVVGEALLAAIDAGHDAPALARRFAALADVGGRYEREDWEDLEVRRLSRLDLDQAIERFEELRGERGATQVSARAVLGRLAGRDEAAARTLAEPYVDEEPFDALPYILGLADGGLPMHEAFERCRGLISPHAYRPAAVFGMLVEHYLAVGDADGLGATVEAGGAHAWQVTLYAHHGLSELARRDGEGTEACLAAALRRAAPGTLASRDASAGLVAGHFMSRPAWLQLGGVHPYELLVLAAVNRGATPRWSLPAPALW